MSEPVLEVEDLNIRYETDGGDVAAVTDASFAIDDGEYHGLVGESGCGKSTIAKSVIGGLDANGYVSSGRIKFRGEEIQDFTDGEYSDRIRWKNISMIPQASMNSLDPVMRIHKQALDLSEVHTDWSEEETMDRLAELFDIVGLPPGRMRDYPHQFSGGMQQRVVIALALLLEPDLIIADEPTTALDVIMQDQVMAYLQNIKEDIDVSLLMITHDISLVFEECDSMTVMHGGQVAESGSIRDVFYDPKHPYSILLQKTFPDIRFPDQELTTIEGTPPILSGEVTECTFADRCPWAEPACREGAPPLEASDGNPNHLNSCIRSHEMDELAADETRHAEVTDDSY